jgi:hypothetical protein
MELRDWFWQAAVVTVGDMNCRLRLHLPHTHGTAFMKSTKLMTVSLGTEFVMILRAMQKEGS